MEKISKQKKGTSSGHPNRKLDHLQNVAHDLRHDGVNYRRNNDPNHWIRNNDCWKREEQPRLRRKVLEISLHGVLLQISTEAGAKKFRANCQVNKSHRTQNLFEELADQPHVAEGVENRSLQHAPDGFWADCDVLVFFYGAAILGSCRYRLAVSSDRVVNKQLDANCGEPYACWAAGPVVGRFGGQKEACAIDRQPSYDICSLAEAPQKFRAKGLPVEINGGASVADSEHGRYLCRHRALFPEMVTDA